MKSEIKAGQRWRDKRHPLRAVEIESAGEFVHYHTIEQRWAPASLQSRIGRFERSFEFQPRGNSGGSVAASATGTL